MRVAHVIKATGIAGAERHLLILLAGLRARGVDAQLLLLVEPRRPMDSLIEQAEARGVPVGRIPIHHHLNVGVARKLRAAFAEMKPDIVHTHLLHADLYGIPAARLARVPVVMSSRHNDNAFRRRLPLRLTNRLLWRMTDGGIAASDAVRRFSITVEGVAPKKIQTIYYGLERTPDDALRQTERAAMRAELGVDSETPVVGMICRLIEQKGVSYGIEAFAQVAAQFPKARLVIAGDGPLRGRLEAQAAALGVRDQVAFLGWRTDSRPVFAGLDIFLMPSLWEGFGLVLLEAMSQRLPIIASRVSAIPEVVADGETGWLVPPRDVQRLAAALQTLLADAPLRRHMGLMGEDRLEELFTAERMTDETLALYKTYLARRGRATS